MVYCNPVEIFEPGKRAFDDIALPVSLGVERINDLPTIFLVWDDRLGATLGEKPSQVASVTAFVGEQTLAG